MEHPTTIAVDLAKSVFEVAVSREPGRVCQRRRLTRSQMAAFFANRPPATVLMEACGYLRTLLTHGARSVLWAAKHDKTPDALRRWALSVQARRGHNRATIALANKLARIAWAVWSKNTLYQPAAENTLS